MGRYALDASVLLARLLGESYGLVNEFWDNLAPDDEVIGAQLLLPECCSVIRESVANGRINNIIARNAVEYLIALPIITCLDRSQFPRAIALAERFRTVKAYDMQYLAAAEITEADLVTIDGGLRQAAIEVHHPVRFLR